MKYLHTFTDDSGNINMAFTKGFCVDVNFYDDNIMNFNLTTNDINLNPKDIGVYLKSVDDITINKIKIIDTFDRFKEVCFSTFKGHNGVIIEDMEISEGTILKELLFYKNILYIVVQYADNFYIYKTTIPEIEKIKDGLPSEEIITKMLHKREIELIEDVVIIPQINFI